MVSSTRPLLAYINHSISFLFVITLYLLAYLKALFVYAQFAFVLLLFSVIEARKLKGLLVLI